MKKYEPRPGECPHGWPSGCQVCKNPNYSLGRKTKVLGKKTRRKLSQKGAIGYKPPTKPGRKLSNQKEWASDVTVTSGDNVTTHRPYGKRKLQSIVKQRDDVTPAVRRAILKRDRKRCRYCGTTKGPFEIDHVVPVSKGGRGEFSNLVTACQRCNQKKGANIWKPRPVGRTKMR